MKSNYFMVRPSITHIPTFEDQRRSAFRHFLTPKSELNVLALADENNKYFGAFIFHWKVGIWDIVRDNKLIEYEKTNPSGLRSRYIAAFKTKTEADRIWMTVKKGW